MSCPGRSTSSSAATSALSVRDGVLYFAPPLTDRLDGLSFPMQFRGTPIRVTLADDELTVDALAEGFSRPIRVGVGDEVRELGAGRQWRARSLHNERGNRADRGL